MKHARYHSRSTAEAASKNISGHQIVATKVVRFGFGEYAINILWGDGTSTLAPEWLMQWYVNTGRH